MKRVYHPTNNAFQDVPDDAVEAWSKAGWRKTPHDGIDESESSEVGNWAPVSVPVLDVTQDEPVTAPRAEVVKPADKVGEK